MTDNDLLTLYQERDEKALSETQTRFGGCCYTIAYNILGNVQDAEECINDTLVQLWNSIPPAAPDNFYAYIAVLVRNIAKNRFRHLHVQKRGGSEMPVALDELVQLASNEDSVEQQADAHALGNAINTFLQGLPQKQRILFVQRYWYNLPVDDIAKEQHLPKGTVTVTLMRVRKKLQSYLQKEGLL